MTSPIQRASAALGFLCFAVGCSDSEPENPQVGVNTVTCTQSGQDATSISYVIAVTGFARGPVGTVLTPEIGFGTGVADANRTIESVDQSSFTGWSFGTGRDDITRADGDVASTQVTVQVAPTKNKPVSAGASAYARFHLAVPSGTPMDAERNTFCP